VAGLLATPLRTPRDSPGHDDGLRVVLKVPNPLPKEPSVKSSSVGRVVPIYSSAFHGTNEKFRSAVAQGVANPEIKTMDALKDSQPFVCSRAYAHAHRPSFRYFNFVFIDTVVN
jgi:hypothetical protein